MSTPYNACASCQAHLDHGEICDCGGQAPITARATAETARLDPISTHYWEETKRQHERDERARAAERGHRFFATL